MSDLGDRPGPWRFPDLPIVNAGPSVPARGEREKYGGLFYLGIGGLLFLVALVGWFGHGLWSHRDLWADVYTLHDPGRSETDRVEAAARLERDPRLDAGEKMEMSLERNLPELARYLLAEGASTELVARNPRAFAFAVARSPGWPDWLRLLLARRLAYAAARGYDIPSQALEELRRHPDPMIQSWAVYACVVQPHSAPDPALVAELEKAAETPGPAGELGALLLETRSDPPKRRERRLDEVTVWMRRHHTQAARIWQGWDVQDQRLVRIGSR